PGGIAWKDGHQLDAQRLLALPGCQDQKMVVRSVPGRLFQQHPPLLVDPGLVSRTQRLDQGWKIQQTHGCFFVDEANGWARRHGSMESTKGVCDIGTAPVAVISTCCSSFTPSPPPTSPR